MRGRIPRTSFFFWRRVQTRHFDFWARAPHRIPVGPVLRVDHDNRKLRALVLGLTHVQAAYLTEYVQASSARVPIRRLARVNLKRARFSTAYRKGEKLGLICVHEGN